MQNDVMTLGFIVPVIAAIDEFGITETDMNSLEKRLITILNTEDDNVRMNNREATHIRRSTGVSFVSSSRGLNKAWGAANLARQRRALARVALESSRWILYGWSFDRGTRFRLSWNGGIPKDNVGRPLFGTHDTPRDVLGLKLYPDPFKQW